MAIRVELQGGRRRPGFDDRGFALIAILFLTMVITLIGLAFYQVAGYEIHRAQYQRDYAQAFWAAETGLDRTVVSLAGRNQPPWSTEQTFRNEVVGNGTYDVEIIPDPANTVNVEKLFTIRSTGRSGRAARVLEEVVRMEGFNRYGYFTNQEVSSTSGNAIYFLTGDDVGGRTHTNGIFYINGSPQFRGPVSTASNYMVGNPDIRVYGPGGWPAGANHPVFHEGLTLGIPSIDLPADTGDLRDAAQDGGLNLTGNYELMLGRNAQGEISYRPLSGGAWSDVQVSSLGSGVVHVTGNAQLSGVLDGELTVGASGTIEIIGDVRYASAHPGTGKPNAGSDDILGIVAGKNVVVRDLPATNGNVVIDATIMALGTSFTAENYNSGSPRGTLHVWGGLIQDRRGPVGFFRGSSLTSGYIKDYHYDERMSIKPPPQFPLTGVYSRISWKEMGVAS
jgi:Tfp pilus assembly protein PilX